MKMKKLILILLVFSVNISFSQECKLSLNQLFKVFEYNHSDFDTFALKNGFSYNSQDKVYQCDNVLNPNVLAKYELSGITTLAYTFLSKEYYLNFKEELEIESFIEKYNRDDVLGYRYTYNGYSISIETKSLTSGNNAYTILINKI